MDSTRKVKYQEQGDNILEELDKFCKNIIRYSLNIAKSEGNEIKNKES